MPELFSYDVPGGALFTVLLGVALLLAGRRIFWLVVGVAGFLVASSFTSRWLAFGSPEAELLVAVLAGIAGIFLAIFLQRVAVGLAGFLIGGYAAVTVLGEDPGVLSAGEALAFLVGGVVCAVLALMLFEWALIVLSSLAGAGLVLEGLGREPSADLVIYAVMVAVGIAVQMGIGPRKRRRRYRREYD